jgi:hypothetical protein
MSGITRISKVRKEHVCDACGGIINKGDRAFVRSVLLTAYQRYPDIYYYHFKDGITLVEFATFSPNDIRKEICRYIEAKEL